MSKSRKEMDKLSSERRSWNMSQIKGKDTTPEKAVRSALHKMGYRFRLHRRDLPGTPDIVLPKYRTVIFVHGCFWHRHKECRNCTMPTGNREFWKKKFSDNINRDRKNMKALELSGWHFLVIWECEVNSSSWRRRLSQFVEQQPKNMFNT